MLLAATLIAPIAAAPAGTAAMGVMTADSPRDILMLPFIVLITPLMLASLYGYVFAFLPCLVGGAVMSALSLSYPPLRRKRVWAAAGAASGAALGAFSGALALLAPAASAGACCALVFRLVVGRGLFPRAAEAQRPA